MCKSQKALVVWTLYEMYDGIIAWLVLPLNAITWYSTSGADSVLRRKHIIPQSFIGQEKLEDSSRESN